MQGVFLDRGSLRPEDLAWESLESALPQWRFLQETPPGAVAQCIADAEVVVSNKLMLDAASLHAAPRLRLVCIAATGTNNVDLAAAQARGIAVCNVRGYATPSVVQHVFALMLALSGRLLDYDRAVRRGDWQRAAYFALLDFPITELAGRTLGIVGYGELGRAVASVASALGMSVKIAALPGRSYDGVPARVPWDQLLEQVDVLSLHCPLTPDTRDLLDAAALARLKRGALLINTARGGLIDEPALAAALRRGQLGGAGIDVLSVEPPVNGNPLLVADIPNLIVTPHIAWASRASRQRLVEELALNIRAFRAGVPRNLVS